MLSDVDATANLDCQSWQGVTQLQKFFIIAAFILLSSVAAAAQTVEERQAVTPAGTVELARRVEAENAKKAKTGLPILSAKTGVDARRSGESPVVDGRVLRLGPTTTYLKRGLSREEVVQVLGKPLNVSERQEGTRLFSTYTFRRSAARVLVAEFENDLLVDSRMERAASE
jgi:hypothetical protein